MKPKRSRLSFCFVLGFFIFCFCFRMSLLLAEPKSDKDMYCTFMVIVYKDKSVFVTVFFTSRSGTVTLNVWLFGIDV